MGLRAKQSWVVAPPPRQLARPGESTGSWSGARQLEEQSGRCTALQLQGACAWRASILFCTWMHLACQPLPSKARAMEKEWDRHREKGLRAVLRVPQLPCVPLSYHREQ